MAACGHTAEEHAAEIRGLLRQHPEVVIPGALDLLVDSIIEQEST